MSCTLQLWMLLRAPDRFAPVTRTRLPSMTRRTLSAAACASALVRAPAPIQAVIPNVPPGAALDLDPAVRFRTDVERGAGHRDRGELLGAGDFVVAEHHVVTGAIGGLEG